MKVLIVSMNCPWSSWPDKIKLLKDWYKPAIDLQIDLVHKMFGNIPFLKDGTGKYQQIDRTWMEQNIIDKQYDLVYFQMDQFTWKCYPLQAAYFGKIGGVHVIEAGHNEFGQYDFMGTKYDGDLWFNMARHELSHALYAINKPGQFDPTHTYWENRTIDQVLTDLKPKSAPPSVTITRKKTTKKEILGELVAINGGAKFTCKTLELPWLNNIPNISCIPSGTYNVKYTFSPRMFKWTYEIQKVPGRSGIRLHSGNYFKDFLGCIGLGATLADINSDGELDITNSRVTISAFERFMGKKDFILTII